MGHGPRAVHGHVEDVYREREVGCYLIDHPMCPSYEALRKVSEWYFTPARAKEERDRHCLLEWEGKLYHIGEGGSDVRDWGGATLISAEPSAIVIRVEGINTSEEYRVTFEGGRIASCEPVATTTTARTVNDKGYPCL